VVFQSKRARTNQSKKKLPMFRPQCRKKMYWFLIGLVSKAKKLSNLAVIKKKQQQLTMTNLFLCINHYDDTI